LAPENVYDISKIAAERLTGQARRNGLETIALRFGRFFFPSQSDYHLRKLSTGLDVYDACQAVALALSRPLTDQAVYCVASDLALTRRQREDLGLDLPKVLRDVLPGFAEKIAARGWSLPARVGKSVDTSLIQEDFGYRPQRNLAWINRVAAKHAEMSTVLSESPAAADEGVRGGLGGSHQALADAIGWDIHRSPAC
jgi:nucleoside-diphosphate-sugar epimerase